MSDRLTSFNEGDGHEVWLVDPYGEGAIANLDSIEMDARQRSTPPAVLAANAAGDDRARVQQLTAAGYTRTFSMVALERDLSAIDAPTALRIRNATGADAPAMLDLTRVVWADREFFTMPTIEQYRDWLATSDLSLFWLAVDDNERLIGYVVVRPDDSGDLEVDDLLVAPSHQRQGIASALLALALEEGRARGFTRAWLTTDGDDPVGARRFYERLGFVVFSEALRFRKPLDERV
jgi:ribosomal protein S18 acetylase RimI-like enzyme